MSIEYFLQTIGLFPNLCFITLLLIAAFLDIKSRIIPDSISIILAAISLIPPEPTRIIGILIAVPLLLAGLTIGGIGGGDIKITGACGMMLGLERAFTGLFIGLLFLIFFHLIRAATTNISKRKRKQKPEQAYPLVPFLTAGMLLML